MGSGDLSSYHDAIYNKHCATMRYHRVKGEVKKHDILGE
jgi:hypothetical protein